MDARRDIVGPVWNGKASEFSKFDQIAERKMAHSNTDSDRLIVPLERRGGDY